MVDHFFRLILRCCCVCFEILCECVGTLLSQHHVLINVSTSKSTATAIMSKLCFFSAKNEQQRKRERAMKSIESNFGSRNRCTLHQHKSTYYKIIAELISDPVMGILLIYLLSWMSISKRSWVVVCRSLTVFGIEFIQTIKSKTFPSKVVSAGRRIIITIIVVLFIVT